jgi:hypothetical protein
MEADPELSEASVVEEGFGVVDKVQFFGGDRVVIRDTRG